VVEECASVTVHEPWLTLRGLEIVFARNVWAAPRRTAGTRPAAPSGGRCPSP